MLKWESLFSQFIFIAVDGLGKEKQMFHGHHFTPLSPELAMDITLFTGKEPFHTD